MKFSDLSSILSPEHFNMQAGNVEIQALMLDTRKPILAPGTLFVALRGKNHDAHRHLDRAYAEGIRHFLVEDASLLPSQTDVNVCQVGDSLQALQLLAAHHRSKYHLPVVAVTGSNGKTIVKEWLASLTQGTYRVIKSPKSYNSQTGVPLSLWQLREVHTLGIFEAGISQPGEMLHLARMIKPDVGIFTNIGPAHDEGFKNRREKIEEKAQLFRDTSSVIYRYDYTQIGSALKTYCKGQLISWGNSSKANYKIKWVTQASGARVEWIKNSEIQGFKLPFSDPASLENVTHALIAALELQVPIPEIRERLEKLTPVQMRLTSKAGRKGCWIIDDTYNNDLAGLETALQYLQQQRRELPLTVILSDILQSGQSADNLYQQVAETLKKYPVNRLIGLGEDIANQKNNFTFLTSSFYPSAIRFLENPPVFRNERILIKGARDFHLEKIVEFLQEKIHDTVLEIDLDALVHNLNYFRSLLAPSTRLMVMVKAFAYGTGLVEVAELLAFHQVDYLAVAYVDEGVQLRNHGISLPIMVLNPTAEGFSQLIDNRLEPEIYSKRLLERYLNYCSSLPEQEIAPIHLKIDTGMHRLGLTGNELTETCRQLANSQIPVASIFTHLASAENENDDSFSRQQLNIFDQWYEEASKLLGYRPTKHALNSPGIQRWNKYQYDMVRLGIGLYGVDATGKNQTPLKPIGTLKTVISQIKNLKKGDSIGYGRKGKMQRDGKIGTIAIGYADGFSRSLSNGKGYVLVNGKQAPVIGNVCMDMTMVDLTGLEAREGEEVIVFGKGLPVEELARQMNTIPYDVLTRISPRVRRVFYSN